MYLFLSPHFDDAVLSCGGRIHQLVKAGQTVIVRTVMGQNPNPNRVPDTPIIRELHNRWQIGDSPMTQRIAEDEVAVQSLGATAQRMTVWADSVYRVSRRGEALYPSEQALFGGIHPEDDAGQLIPTIVLPPRDVIHTLFAPLGAGNHIDHQIVRNWALELRKQNPVLALKFYEEYPYSQNQPEVDRALSFIQAQGMRLEAETIRLDETDVEAKLQAIALYRSQISTFWHDVEAMRQAAREFMLRVGDGTPAERYWCVPTG